MAEYNIGQLVQLSANFVNATQVPTDPTTVVLTIQSPDGTKAIFSGGSLTHPTTGQYTYNLSITQSGIYAILWVGTGTVQASYQYTVTASNTIFNGARPNPIDLCVLDQVKAWLTIAPTITSSDVLISQLITQASLFIMNRTGIGSPVGGGVPTVSPFTSIVSLNESYDGSGTARQFIRTPPVQTVTALVINGVNVPAFTTPNSWGYAIDDGGASLVMIGGGSFAGFSVSPGGAWGGGGFARGPMFGSGFRNVNVQYTAGYSVTPYDLTQACVELVGYTIRKRQWIGQRSQAMAQAGGSTSYVPWDIAPQVEAIIRSYTRRALV